jgi:very-short-patch-repair endonuclease
MDRPERKMFYGATPSIFNKASLLRVNQTFHENLLWQKLRKNQLCGFRFKRQHPIGYYVADFYCHKAKLVIEVDGKYHHTPKQILIDSIRTTQMELYGLTVLRFNNDEIEERLDNVLERITLYLLKVK